MFSDFVVTLFSQLFFSFLLCLKQVFINLDITRGGLNLNKSTNLLSKAANKIASNGENTQKQILLLLL